MPKNNKYDNYTKEELIYELETLKKKVRIGVGQKEFARNT